MRTRTRRLYRLYMHVSLLAQRHTDAALARARIQVLQLGRRSSTVYSAALQTRRVHYMQSLGCSTRGRARFSISISLSFAFLPSSSRLQSSRPAANKLDLLPLGYARTFNARSIISLICRVCAILSLQRVIHLVRFHFSRELRRSARSFLRPTAGLE